MGEAKKKKKEWQVLRILHVKEKKKGRDQKHERQNGLRKKKKRSNRPFSHIETAHTSTFGL